MKKSTSLLIVAAVAGLVQACSNNDGSSAANVSATRSDTAKAVPATAPPAANIQADTAFVQKAAMGGMTEVALGKMAADKAKDTRVKDFGNRMVTDHGKVNDELKSIAGSKNIQLPAGLDAKHQALSDSLGKMSGKAFDTAYVNAMLNDHKDALALMQSEASNGTDAELKAFAGRTAPLIQSHLDMIQKIHDAMK